MKVFLCVAALLLVGALAAPAPDGEEELNEAVAEAEVNAEADLTAAATLEESNVDKRGSCSVWDMQGVVRCFGGISSKLRAARDKTPCGMRTLLLNEFNACARNYGCDTNFQIRRAIRMGMQRYDLIMRMRGITC